MPTETILRTVRLSAGAYYQDVDIGYYLNQSTNSPRVNGKIKLRANPHDFVRNYMPTWDYDSNGWGLRLPWEDANSGNLIGAMNGIFATSGNAWTQLTNEALARFTGKVRKHNASLGVTFATFREASRMITDRSQKIATIFKRAEYAIQRLSPKERRRRGVQGTAGALLEGQFGWVPLVEDIQKGFEALGQLPPPEWVRARAKTRWTHSILNKGAPGSHSVQREWDLDFWLTLSARVDISSENGFLLNRLGLLNMPGVAWDIVPWSFVVNLVSNAGQMVNSVTDFAGVTLSDTSTTRVISGTQNYNAWTEAPSTPYGFAEALTNVKMRRRNVGGLPTATFQMRVPDMNLGLASIAWALVAQRVSRISSLCNVK